MVSASLGNEGLFLPTHLLLCLRGLSGRKLSCHSHCGIAGKRQFAVWTMDRNLDYRLSALFVDLEQHNESCTHILRGGVSLRIPTSAKKWSLPNDAMRGVPGVLDSSCRNLKGAFPMSDSLT